MGDEKAVAIGADIVAVLISAGPIRVRCEKGRDAVLVLGAQERTGGIGQCAARCDQCCGTVQNAVLQVAKSREPRLMKFSSRIKFATK